MKGHPLKGNKHSLKWKWTSERRVKMKTSMMKLGAFVMIAAIAMFMAEVMASAGGIHKDNNSIHGEYYFIGAGPCLLAPGGFNDVLQPIFGEDGPWNMSNATWEGVYTFKPNGTGEIKAIFRVVERPSNIWFSAQGLVSGSDIPDAGAANVRFKFNYTVSETGRIKFTYKKGSYVADFVYGPQAGSPLYLDVSGSWYGVLSPDGKNIIVTWGVPVQLIVTADQGNTIPQFPVVCNAAQQGFRCDDECPELVYSLSPAP
jgi:hypothetical protein